MNKHLFFVVTIAALIGGVIFIGCEDKHAAPTSPPQQNADIPALSEETQQDLAELGLIKQDPLAYYTARTDNPPVQVPAGSHNAFAAALVAAGSHGIIIVKAGMHIEDTVVNITHPVTIVGEHGATVKFECGPYFFAPGTVLDVGFYILGTSNVTISGINFLPVGQIGGTAILVQNSPRVTIACNAFHEFQWSTLVHHGDRARLFANTVVASDRWLTSEIPESEGMILINGKYGLVAENNVSGGYFGLWPTDENGVFINNYTHGNNYGIMLCCVPDDAFALPNGEFAGSDTATTKWLVINNTSSNNFDSGMLVIDKANSNLIVNNGGSGNPVYDIELSGDSYRFGFLTPRCRKNTVIAGRYNPLIKNCGENNTIIGGTLQQSDPCR